MQTLIKRNLLLYFRDKTGVFFSILGAFISFILYLIFLKETMTSEWSQLPQTNQLLDNWLISGTLTIVEITTTLASLTQLVKDRENNVRQDLLLTDISTLRLHLSYLLSAALIGIIMQMLLFSIMFPYFYFTNHTVLTLPQLASLLVLMIFNALLAATLNLMLVQPIKTVDNVGKLSSVIGTAAGFLVGTYVPIGALPSFAQLLVKLTPGGYIASLYRQILLAPTITNVFKDNPVGQKNFEEAMGVRFKLFELLTIQQTCLILMIILFFACFVALFPQWLKAYKNQRALFHQ